MRTYSVNRDFLLLLLKNKSGACAQDFTQFFLFICKCIYFFFILVVLNTLPDNGGLIQTQSDHPDPPRNAGYHA